MSSEAPSTTRSATTSLVGTKAKSLAVNPGTFDFRNTGGWGGGPIVPNKLFFFFNHENEAFDTAGDDVPRQHGRGNGQRAA